MSITRQNGDGTSGLIQLGLESDTIRQQLIKLKTLSGQVSLLKKVRSKKYMLIK
jgi:hypothetical protein